MSNDLTTTKNNLPAVPDYLKVEGDTSIDDLKQYIRPNRVKVIQSMTDDELKNAFGLASVIVVPENLLIMSAAKDDKGNPNPGTTPPFLFTPIFHFTEFCSWNPLEAKGQLPAIYERSFDPTSLVARKARDFRARTEVHPDNPDWKLTHCEHINFIVMIQGLHEPCVLTFSRGEFKAGTSFAGIIKARYPVPLYGNVFAANLAYRQGKKGNWYGLDISNPPGEESPFLGEETFQAYRLLYEEYKRLHGEQRIDINYEDEPIEVASAPSEAADSM
jgi:hypothetical protein